MTDNGKVKIDKRVPIPPSNSGRHAKYPWMELEVGESFLLSAGLSPNAGHSMASRASAAYGRKFLCRKTDEGYRVWRVE